MQKTGGKVRNQASKSWKENPHTNSAISQTILSLYLRPREMGQILELKQCIRSVSIFISLQQVQLQGMANTMALEHKTQKEEILLLTSCEPLHQVK